MLEQSDLDLLVQCAAKCSTPKVDAFLDVVSDLATLMAIQKVHVYQWSWMPSKQTFSIVHADRYVGCVIAKKNQRFCLDGFNIFRRGAFSRFAPSALSDFLNGDGLCPPVNVPSHSCEELPKHLVGVVHKSTLDGSMITSTVLGFEHEAKQLHPQHISLLLSLLPGLEKSLGVLIASQAQIQAGSELSAREVEVLNWAAEGKSAWEIGTILNIAERTVNFHFQNIYRKLMVKKRPHAIAKAIEAGIIQRASG